MKRFTCAILFVLYTCCIFAQEIKYKAKIDTIVSKTAYTYRSEELFEQGWPIKEGTEILYRLGEYYAYLEISEYSIIQAQSGDINGYFVLDDLERKNLNREIHDNLNGCWISAYTYDILKENSLSALNKYEPYWENRFKAYGLRPWDGDKWQDIISPTELIITDNLIRIDTFDEMERDFLIFDEKKTERYEIRIYLDNNEKIPPYYEKNNFLFKLNKVKVQNVSFTLEGDYLKLYSDSEKQPLMTFARAYNYQDIMTKIRAIANGVTIDLSRVTWPRHADGTCDYDGRKAHTTNKTAAISSTPTTNVAPSKTMTVKENLKLRSGEAATTSVLAVMSTGTKVKILTIGKQATIDGITSNWVQVEVLAGAKDRDGKPIAAGTRGGCFGGYLE